MHHASRCQPVPHGADASTGRSTRRPLQTLVVVLAAGALLAGCTLSGTAQPPSASSTSTAAPSARASSTAASSTAASPTAAATTASRSRSTSTAKPGSALAVLRTLQVKGKSPLTGYRRVADFGTAWLDVDHNGCDTRNDVLRRDLTHTTGSGCIVRSGTLSDPYTGATIHFVRGPRTSLAVQIDHVVPLANAWVTGAQRLTEAQRIALANDPINLFAVDGPTNERKGDGDAATWLPPNRRFRCTYVAHQVGVKAAYHLWVTPAEKAAMERVLGGCAGVAAPRSTLAAAAAQR